MSRSSHYKLREDLTISPRVRRTLAQASAQGLPLGSVLEVTEGAGGGCHRKVLPLYDLGMAGRTSKVLPSPELSQVLSVDPISAARHGPRGAPLEPPGVPG